MNGVFRGGFSWASKVLYVRGGYRYVESMRGIGGSALGFRLVVNGVRRGGVYNDYARYCKCVYRNSYAKGSGHREIGFRCEWCKEG